MEENKTPPTFTWTGYGDVTPLPTDYSPKYLEGRWKINDSKISAYITKHLDFEYFYQWMRYVSPEHHRTEPFDYRGIPAELEPFFHEYIKEAISRKIKPDSLQLDERILKDFDNDLALHLHRMASAAEQNYKESDNSVDSGLYWYRRLYDNLYFQKSVSIDYWDREYDWRCNAIKKLSQELPQEEQIGLLKDLICTLDIKLAYVCARRKQIKEDAEQEKTHLKKKPSCKIKETFLHTFPLQLIEKLRRFSEPKGTPASNSRKSYSVRNASLGIENSSVMTLEDAFPLMLTNIDARLREQVRATYLNHTCTTPQKSVFQQSCEDLQSYLDMYAATPEEIKKRKKYIQDYCLRYYRGLWHYAPPLDDSVNPISKSKPALDRFIDNIIGSYCRTYSDMIKEKAALILPKYNNKPEEQCQKSYDEYLSLDGKYRDERAKFILQSKAQSINEVLQTLWIDYFLPPRTLQDNVFSDEDLDNICNFMEHHCSVAHEVLQGQKLPWATKDTFQKAWKRFYQTQNEFTSDAVPAYCDILDIYLVYAMLVLRTWVSFDETVHTTSMLLDCFIEYMNNRNGRSHKATCQDSVTSAEDSKQPDANRSGTGTGQP